MYFINAKHYAALIKSEFTAVKCFLIDENYEKLTEKFVVFII